MRGPMCAAADEKPKTDEERCYAAALRLLGYRWRATEELRRKLRDREFTPALIEPTLERLAAEGWLDDERFAAEYARSRAKKRGRIRIARELQELGVAREVATRAAADVIESEDERLLVQNACRKRIRILDRRGDADFDDEGEGRRKLIGYLLQLGYDYAVVREVAGEEIRRHLAQRSSDGDELLS